MKKIISDFFLRGLIASGIGPIVLGIIYLILQHHVGIETLTINQVRIGIFSLSALAFLAGGMNAIYQIEQIPLMVAISIHGGVLYLSYLVTYLANGWLEWGIIPILVFTGIFVLGYFVIWAIIYFIIKKRTKKINTILREKQKLNKYWK